MKYLPMHRDDNELESRIINALDAWLDKKLAKLGKTALGLLCSVIVYLTAYAWAMTHVFK